MRRSAFIVIGILGLLLVLSLATALLLPAERIGAFAVGRAAAAIDSDITVQRFRVQLLPRPAVALEEVRVGGPRTHPDTARFASARRIELRPRIMPLLRRHVVIDRIVVDRPEIFIRIAEDGTSNVPALVDGDASDEAGGDAELSISRLRVRHGVIAYVDESTGRTVSAAGIDQTLGLTGSLTAGDLSRIVLDGDLTIGELDADLPGTLAWPVRNLRLRVEHAIDVDRTADRLEFTELRLTVQEVALDVSGSITAFSDADTRTVALRAATASFDVAQLIESLPRSLLEGASGDALEGAAGRAQIEATVNGRAGAGAVPDVAGVLRLDDVGLRRGRHGTIASGINGDIAFSLDSVASPAISGRLLDEPLRLSFSIHDLAAPQGRAALNTAVALAEAQKLGLLPEGSAGTGRVTVDATVEGSQAAPGDAHLDGHIGLAGVRLTLDALEQPVIVRDGRIELRGRSLRATGVTADIGRSDVALDFNADNWLPYALGDTTRTPTVRFEARATTFDVDEIFGVDPEEQKYSELFFARLTRRQIDGMTATQVAEQLGLGLPTVPPIDLDGKILARRLIHGAVPFDDVEVTVATRNRELEVRGANFRMMGGGVQMTGRLGAATRRTGDDVTQPLRLDYTVDDVTASRFLERYMTFRDQVGGRLLLTGSLQLDLDRHLLPVTESLNGNGTIAISDGELVNWPLLRTLGERIGVAGFDTVAFRDWSGRYRIAGGTVVLDESVLESGDLVVRAAGSFAFTGILDLGATVYMPQRWATRLPGAPTGFLVNLVAGPDGRVPVGARISGTARDPVIQLDMTEASARAADAAREAAQAEGRAMAARIAEDLAERMMPADSVTAGADSLKRRAEEEVVNRLRRVLRPGNRDSVPR
jgi:uncharacterized protein involved in outer membrane biogenesis